MELFAELLFVRSGDNRRAEIAQTWSFGTTALVEEYIPGRELTVGIMGAAAIALFVLP